MKNSELKFRKEYWNQVFQCLIQFHNYNETNAKSEITKYKRRFPINSMEPEFDLIYHIEPFRLACRITGKKLSVKDYAEDYQKILHPALKTQKTQKGKDSINVHFGDFSTTSKKKRTSEKRIAAAKSAPTKKVAKKAFKVTKKASSVKSKSTKTRTK